MKLLELFKTHLDIVAGIIGSLLVIIPAVRQAVVRLFKACIFLVRAPFIILEKVEGLEKRGSEADIWRAAVDRKLEVIEHEVRDNDGGSIKDHTKRQEARHRADFWGKGRPAMELHLSGHLILVSEALCRLLSVRDPHQLLGGNWQRYVEAEHIEKMLDLITDIDPQTTLFRFQTRLDDDHRQPVGIWEFNGSVIDPPIAGKRLLSGHWSPVDAKAKEISARYNWAS